MAIAKSKYNPSIGELTAITPLDGRYKSRIIALSEYTSEYGLIRIRIEIEAKYLIALSEVGVVRKLTTKEKDYLLNFANKLKDADILLVKLIEQETRHDVKAMERAFRIFLDKTTLSDIVEMIHFGLTSSDVNNLAFNLMLKRATHNVVIPTLEKLSKALYEKAEKGSDVPMLARTHGQAAVPTTLGKEYINFAERLTRQIKKLRDQELSGKLNGAVGNYNALVAVFPNVDWIAFSEKFVSSLGLQTNLYTTQINNYDDVAEYLQTYSKINTILIGFNQDVWRYISDHWFVQENVKGEVGSSTMPQKVNPIDFENSEGNLGMANALLNFMAGKLPVSRLQRDLSDSTVVRNFGTALGFCMVGYLSTITGLGRIKPNLEVIKSELNLDWSILSEGVQTILRYAGVEDPYSLIAKLVRGNHINQSEWIDWVENLPVDKKIKTEIAKLTPHNYIGLAQTLTEKAVKQAKKR